MDIWFGHSCQVFLYEGEGCQVTEGGVVLDREEIKTLMGACGVDDEGVVASYALGHERTHFAQIIEAGGVGAFRREFEQTDRAQLLEIEADFVAGLFLGKSLLTHEINFLQLPRFAEIIGNLDWPKGVHPAPEQRVLAIMRGLNVGAAWIRLDVVVPAADARDMGRQIARHLQGGLRARGFYRF